MLSFSYSENAICKCREHLTETKTFSTEIETFLVHYLLVLICSEFESRVLEITLERVKKTGDSQVFSFVGNIIQRKFRRLRTGEMSELLKQFDSELSDKFDKIVNNSPEQVSFNNIVNNRHDFAHGNKSIEMSFNDLESDFKKAKKIFEIYSSVLGIAS